MLLPKLNALSKTKGGISRFLGYRHLDQPPAGAFYDTQNLSAARCPVLSPRLPRRRIAELGEPNALAGRGELAWVAGGQLVYGGQAVAPVAPGQKQLVGMGAWLIVWPDGVRYNTRTGAVDQLRCQNAAENAELAVCSENGTPYAPLYTGITAPDPAEADYWLNTAESPCTLKQYNAATKLWEQLAGAYLSISAAGLGAGFAAGDTVTVAGAAAALCGDHLLLAAEPDRLILAALPCAPEPQPTLTVERRLPQLDFLTECNNRLWGCCSATNELYACKLGDPTNWYAYAGLDTDSYAATLGTEGPFTGAVTYLGYVLFFKENCIHKVYGAKPGNFQISATFCRGVQPGSEKSLCLVNETLYYKSDTDLCRYDGSLPESVSAALGETVYGGAVAGAAGSRYYVSMQNAAGGWELFCLDTAAGIWCREDTAHAAAFAALGAAAYLLDAAGTLWQLETPEPGDPETTDGPVAWYAETGPLGAGELDAKYFGRLQLRLYLPAGSSFAAAVQYDTAGWEPLAELTAPADRSVRLPLRLRRCDHARLRFSGRGPCRVYALGGTLYTGRTGKEVTPLADP